MSDLEICKRSPEESSSHSFPAPIKLKVKLLCSSSAITLQVCSTTCPSLPPALSLLVWIQTSYVAGASRRLPAASRTWSALRLHFLPLISKLNSLLFSSRCSNFLSLWMEAVTCLLPPSTCFNPAAVTSFFIVFFTSEDSTSFALFAVWSRYPKVWELHEGRDFCLFFD